MRTFSKTQQFICSWINWQQLGKESQSQCWLNSLFPGSPCTKVRNTKENSPKIWLKNNLKRQYLSKSLFWWWVSPCLSVFLDRKNNKKLPRPEALRGTEVSGRMFRTPRRLLLEAVYNFSTLCPPSVTVQRTLVEAFPALLAPHTLTIYLIPSIIYLPFQLQTRT